MVIRAVTTTRAATDPSLKMELGGKNESTCLWVKIRAFSFMECLLMEAFPEFFLF